MELFDTQPLLADVTGLPTYVVDTVVRRDLGSGIASIINCRMLNGVLVPQCEIVVTAGHLISICKNATDFALEMHRRQQMAQMAEMIGRHH